MTIQRKADVRDLSIASAILGTALVVWQLLASGMPDATTPLNIAIRLGQIIADGQLLSALLVSWITILQGFGIAAIAGIGVAMIAGNWPSAASWLEPVINLLRPIAPFAWIPMAILWFGTGGGAAVMITAYAAFFPILTNTLAGVRRIRSSLVTAARVLGASQVTIFLRVVVPGSLPLMLVGLRLGVGMAWAAVIAAELATGQSTTAPPGIGYLMYLNFAAESDVTAIVGMMIAIGLSAFLADQLLRLAARKLIVWPAEG
ncbi:MAG: ABC transporter permease [Rhizobiaceae bacterium]|nr:ABC transporter permease [Rhizobiaceae bacterium]